MVSKARWLRSTSSLMLAVTCGACTELIRCTFLTHNHKPAFAQVALLKLSMQRRTQHMFGTCRAHTELVRTIEGMRWLQGAGSAVGHRLEPGDSQQGNCSNCASCTAREIAHPGCWLSSAGLTQR